MTQGAAGCCEVELAESSMSTDLQQQSCEDRSILSMWVVAACTGNLTMFGVNSKSEKIADKVT